jgi:hypothetical protein
MIKPSKQQYKISSVREVNTSSPAILPVSTYSFIEQPSPENNKRNIDAPALVITSHAVVAVACRRQKHIIICQTKIVTHRQHTLAIIVVSAAVSMINRAVVIVTVVTAIVIVVASIEVSVSFIVKYALYVFQHRSFLISK